MPHLGHKESMNHTTDQYSEDTLGKKYDIKLLGRILPYVGPYRFYFLTAIALIILITLLELSLPYITKIAIDRYIVPGKNSEATAQGVSGDTPERMLRISTDTKEVKRIVDKYPELLSEENGSVLIAYSQLEKLEKKDLLILRKHDLTGITYTALILISIVIVNFLLNFLQTIIMEYTGQMVMHDLRMGLFDHMQHLSVSYFTKNPVGRLVTRATNDIQNLHEMFTSIITFLFKDVFLLVGITVVLISINPGLSLIAFIALPVVMLTAYKFADMARTIFRVLRVKLAEINTRFSETIQGMRIIQLFLKERDNYIRFKALNRENYVAGMEQVRLFAVFMPLIELMGAMTIALVIYYGGLHVLSKTITLGALVAFISYMRMFFRPIRDIAEKFNILQNSMSSMERIFQILDNQSRIQPVVKDDAPASPRRFQTLTFDQVSFGYTPSEPILSDISFTIGKGDTIAIVGPTGAGKTSLINLIVRFYDPTTGAVLVNDTDIRRFDLKALREKIALVSQDPFLFSGSLRENISGAHHMTEQAYGTILETANCTELIKRLPEGLDTRLTEGGASLSSGERQLISIARAVSKNPELIIFDEATSYIDSGSEALIQQAIFGLMQHRTAIIIAHRLATARKADVIYVMKQGRFIESGSHNELMLKKGFYYKLSRMASLTNGKETS